MKQPIYNRAKAAARVTPRSLDNILAAKEAEKFPELSIQQELIQAGIEEDEEDEE